MYFITFFVHLQGSCNLLFMNDNQKYQDIVTNGKKLFWKHGIKRVTVEEICKNANVSKMTYYKFFSNKNELAKTILTDLYQASLNNFKKIIESDLPFSKKLESIFLMKIESTQDFSHEFVHDIYSNPNPVLKEHMNSFAERSKDMAIEFYKKSQDLGYIRKNINIDFIMTYSSHMTLLLNDTKIMSKYDKPADLILEVMNLLFYGIITRDE